MKRSFLKDLGLESDVIDKIMKEYGNSVEKYKNEISDYTAELKEYKSKELDLEKAIKEAESKKETEYQEQLKKFANYDEMVKELEGLKNEKKETTFNNALDKYLKDNKLEFSNSYAKGAIVNKIKEKNFEIKEGAFGDDFNKFITELKTTEKEAFKQNTQVNNTFYTPKTNGGEGNTSNLQAIIQNTLRGK